MQLGANWRGWPVEAKQAMLARLQERPAHPRHRGRFRRYRDDPSGYVRDMLGIRFWAAQDDIAHSVRMHRRTVVYAGQAVGKTHGMAALVQWHFDAFDPSITLTTAPNWPSVHDLLWGEIKAQRRPRAMPGRLLDLRLDGGPMHYAAGHNAESASGFQGRHEERVLLVLDEAMGVPPYIWEAVDAMMTSPDCRVIALGNPTETSGAYYDVRDDPDWHVIRISCLDHPNIIAGLAGQPAPFPKAVNLVWVREMIEAHAQATTEATADAFEWPPGSGSHFVPDDIFRSRVLGLFPRQSSYAIWSEEWLTKARTTRLAWAAHELPELGVDVARYGSDNSNLYARRGPQVLRRESYAKQGTMETVGRVLRMLDALCAEAATRGEHLEAKRLAIKVDDDGLGGGVTDRLRELGYNVVAVSFGERALSPDDYFNRGAEMWFHVARRAERGRLDLRVLADDVYERLSKELLARHYKIQSDRTLRVESKDDLRKRLGRSPDDADALALAFAPGASWQVLDLSEEVRAPATATKPLAPADQQIRAVYGQHFAHPADDEVCGNCAHMTTRGDGTTFCALRRLVVLPQDMQCDEFELTHSVAEDMDEQGVCEANDEES